jgi:hypothetical protein
VQPPDLNNDETKTFWSIDLVMLRCVPVHNDRFGSGCKPSKMYYFLYD